MFLLLNEVGAADEADSAFVAELGQELEHGGGDGLQDGTLVRLLMREGRMQKARRAGGGLTRRAGVRVPSTSKRQMVFLMGRSSRGGMMLAASTIVELLLLKLGSFGKNTLGAEACRAAREFYKGISNGKLALTCRLWSRLSYRNKI